MLNLTRNKEQIRRKLNIIFTMRLAKSKTFGNYVNKRVGKETGNGRSIKWESLSDVILE